MDTSEHRVGPADASAVATAPAASSYMYEPNHLDCITPYTNGSSNAPRLNQPCVLAPVQRQLPGAPGHALAQREACRDASRQRCLVQHLRLHRALQLHVSHVQPAPVRSLLGAWPKGVNAPDKRVACPGLGLVPSTCSSSGEVQYAGWEAPFVNADPTPTAAQLQSPSRFMSRDWTVEVARPVARSIVLVALLTARGSLARERVEQVGSHGGGNALS
jgi:hypothetical protein